MMTRVGKKTRTIAVTNQKGGTGKTTTVVCLAAALGELRRRVLVVDLDPQSSATAWLGVGEGGDGLLSILERGRGQGRALPALARLTAVPGVEIVAGSPSLVQAAHILSGPRGNVATAYLRTALEGTHGHWDVVLVDTAPAMALLPVAALAACREVLVPVEAHALALAGLVRVLQTIASVRADLNPRLKLTGILPTRVHGRTRLAADVLLELRRRFGRDVFRARIRETVRLAEAPGDCRPITQYAPSSHGAADYRAAARELLSRGHGPQRRRK